MTEEVKEFILDNLNLIDFDTKESWEEIYNKAKLLRNSGIVTGQFTEIMIEIGIDPARKLNYIPNNYLYESKLKEYKIPNAVKFIEEEAFSHSSLKYIRFEENSQLEIIQDSAFDYCTSLESIEIPNNTIIIDSHAFYKCASLKDIKIPDKIEYIGASAFANCINLTTLEIPKGISTISYGAFSGCSNLVKVIIPDNVISMRDYVFGHCTSLKEITYKGTKKEALTILKVKNKKWREGSPIQKIICNDGIIEL